MGTLLQDLRYGLRTLAKNPGFTAVAVITLALGIGANTAIFSVISAVLLRPLAYKDPERLVVMNHYYPKLDLKSSVSAIGYTHYRDTNKSFENITAFTDWPVNLTGVGDPERLQGAAVTATFFPTLGVDVAQGRTFSPGEDQQGRNTVVVVSDGLWRRRFGADPQLIGKTLTLDGATYTVIGIMPPGFQFGREFGQAIDLWSPLAFTQSQLQTTQWRNERFNVIARLKPNVTLQQAQAEMDTIAANVRRQHFGSGAANPSSWGLLRPFPVKNPESIANLFRRVHNAPTDARFSYPDYLDYRDHKNVFSDLIASSWVRLGLASSPLSDASGASASPVLLLASTACLDIGLVFYYGAVRSAMTTKE